MNGRNRLEAGAVHPAVAPALGLQVLEDLGDFGSQ